MHRVSIGRSESAATIRRHSPAFEPNLAYLGARSRVQTTLFFLSRCLDQAAGGRFALHVLYIYAYKELQCNCHGCAIVGDAPKGWPQSSNKSESAYNSGVVGIAQRRCHLIEPLLLHSMFGSPLLRFILSQTHKSNTPRRMRETAVRQQCSALSYKSGLLTSYCASLDTP